MAGTIRKFGVCYPPDPPGFCWPFKRISRRVAPCVWSGVVDVVALGPSSLLHQPYIFRGVQKRHRPSVVGEVYHVESSSLHELASVCALMYPTTTMEAAWVQVCLWFVDTSGFFDRDGYRGRGGLVLEGGRSQHQVEELHVGIYYKMEWDFFFMGLLVT